MNTLLRLAFTCGLAHVIINFHALCTDDIAAGAVPEWTTGFLGATVTILLALNHAMVDWGALVGRAAPRKTLVVVFTNVAREFFSKNAYISRPTKILTAAECRRITFFVFTALLHEHTSPLVGLSIIINHYRSSMFRLICLIDFMF